MQNIGFRFRSVKWSLKLRTENIFQTATLQGHENFEFQLYFALKFFNRKIEMLQLLDNYF